jgi:hypothetical protein
VNKVLLIETLSSQQYFMNKFAWETKSGIRTMRKSGGKVAIVPLKVVVKTTHSRYGFYCIIY